MPLRECTKKYCAILNRIFESIDASGTPLKLLKEKYFNLKYKIGRIPTIKEFYKR